MKIVVIGHPEAVLGFSLVGLQGHLATTAAEANQALEAALVDPEVGILLVTNEVAELIEPRMDQLKLRGNVPLVVKIPGPAGISADQPSLDELVFRAIGVKI
jgi:V/A-type H+/Na+-transporting ATPase subunit F